jgi:hypothetical protein
MVILDYLWRISFVKTIVVHRRLLPLTSRIEDIAFKFSAVVSEPVQGLRLATNISRV